MKWVCSEGGPLVAVPAELVSQWTGSKDEPGDDYERACLPVGKITSAGWVDTGFVPYANQHVLVLDGELDTTVVTFGGQGLIVRGGGIRDAEVARDIHDAVPDDLWEPLEVRLNLTDGRLVLLDAAVPGAEPEDLSNRNDTFVAELEPGSYRVEVHGRDRDDDPLILVRLLPA